jgi:hypothetical protein
MVLAGVILCPIPAVAQEGFGFRGGVTIDPEQGFAGMHYLAAVADRLRLQPAAEVGFGSDLTLVTFRVDFTQWFELGASQWSLYVGGGPAVNILRYDDALAQLRGGDSIDVDGGFDFALGFAHRDGVMLEIRVGSAGSPDLRFGVGYTFR